MIKLNMRVFKCMLYRLMGYYLKPSTVTISSNEIQRLSKHMYNVWIIALIIIADILVALTSDLNSHHSVTLFAAPHL